MTTEEFAELLGTARRLSDAGTAIVQGLAHYLKDVKDPTTHATLARLLLTVRDCSQSLIRIHREAERNLALRDAPKK